MAITIMMLLELQIRGLFLHVLYVDIINEYKIKYFRIIQSKIRVILFDFFFRVPQEKDTFLPQKSDGSKTPQFTDVSFKSQKALSTMLCSNQLLMFFLSCSENAWCEEKE